ncbi:MAG: hypothetical protein CVV58_02525 [Tenericutes bacterium HGW-Tenericutes-3]|nr:MAG: hypothetical protein CVV58_02525 [Tenericutes bacterium HGW-Tenericutes-3]
MKKITLFLLLMSFVFGFVQFDVSAEGYDALPLGKNYLNLNNLIMKSDGSGYAYTKELIRIKSFQQYTIVLDYEFLGQHSVWLGDIYIGIQELPSHDLYDFLVLSDNVNQRAYIEFIFADDYMHITSLPMLPNNYNAIMYEGTYADFSGYEPYIDVDDQIDYYGVLPIDYDEPMTLEEIKAYIHAEDPNGNPLVVSAESDLYSSSSKLPGSYQMVFIATCNQIAKRYHLEVRVFDQSAPVIADPGVITVALNAKPDVDTIKQDIVVSDNVDQMTASDLVIIADNYTAATTIGEYTFTVQATDSSFNTSTRTITIDLIDQNGPTITGPSDIYLYTSDTPLTGEQIKAYYTFIDDVDGTNVTTSFSVDTYQQTQAPGIYNMTLKATDQANNFKSLNIHIHVIENRGPVFSTDEIVLSVDAADQMTEQELIDWFTTHTLSLGYNVSHVRILYNEYESHENESGNYYVYLNYEMNGETQSSRLRVDVQNTQSTFNYIPYLAFGVPSIAALAILYIIKRKK